MGVCGCGKSTLMRHLAERLGCGGFEGDSFHGEANVAKMRAGQPLNDGDRWPWLDRLGAAIGAADSALKVLPRFAVYNPLNTWGKKREMPDAPRQTFHAWYKHNRMKDTGR